MKYKTIAEITAIVMECRTSGLTDHQWCKANNINPSTLYRWVQKLRALRCDIPEAGTTSCPVPSNQEVVKLEIVKPEAAKVEYNAPVSGQSHFVDSSSIEIATTNVIMRFSNDVNPELFKTALFNLGGGSSC